MEMNFPVTASLSPPQVFDERVFYFIGLLEGEHGVG